MGNIVINCIFVIVSLAGLLLMEVELAQAVTSSLLLGVFFTLIDIHHELEGRK